MKNIENNKTITNIAVTVAAIALGSFGIGGLLIYFACFSLEAKMKDTMYLFMNIYVVFTFLWPLIIFFLMKLFLREKIGYIESNSCENKKNDTIATSSPFSEQKPFRKSLKESFQFMWITGNTHDIEILDHFYNKSRKSILKSRTVKDDDSIDYRFPIW